ncbi:Inactive receptor kinase precursor [Actinidia chinensis var. chinensis]|uniref:Inactive receptor kinase n=1 Tax=Actinidia chinensis var. chinensis TaxID=1590841 RepID=A0A2R6PR92_ACTCC|nr:Inactive receptor kinase precursor [Actinidia chinensis var. chinensis]
MMTKKSMREIVLRLLILCIATFSLLITVSHGGELPESETENFLNFIQAVDPKNVLRIVWDNGWVPHPCSHNGVKCSLNHTTIRAIRLESLNLCGVIDAKSLCKLRNLEVLSLAQNQIHGTIPDSMLNCTSLRYLNLSSNLLNGSVPIGLAKLKKLNRLDISKNQFKEEFKSLNEYSLDAYAPTGPGNRETGVGKNHKLVGKWIMWMPLVFGIALLFVFIRFLNVREIRSAREKEILRILAQSPTKPLPLLAKDVAEEAKGDDRQSELVFFVDEEERFRMEDLLEAEADLQSQGLCSSLYKVKLKKNAFFAVKRMKKLQASFEEFGATMREIGNLKHPNILPLVGYNSSNIEEKLLIYRYQSKGSLLTLQENYTEGKRDFPWKHRLCIAVGIARGLNYLYQRPDASETIPHGNIKPSNILLNENEEPLISEYGISKFLDPKSACLLNANGYTAPEKVSSEQADVFSVGVILLELLTGKSIEKSGLDLPKWVKSMVREEWTGEVFDREITKAGIYGFSLLNVSLKCVAHFPENRPSIAEVLEKIEEVVNAQEDLGFSPNSSVEFN